MMSKHLCDVRGIRVLVHHDGSVKNVCGGGGGGEQLSEKGKKDGTDAVIPRSAFMEEEVYVPQAGSVLRC